MTTCLARHPLPSISPQSVVTCGGVPIYPGDIIVGDSEGTVAVPAEFAESVAEGGLAQDHIEGWVNRRLAKGDPMPGLYPPSDKKRAEYEKWVAAGEPEDV